MERMWAALLTPPLTPSETRAMTCVAKTADRVITTFLLGSVNNCICGDVEHCGAGLERKKKKEEERKRKRQLELDATPEGKGRRNGETTPDEE